MRKMVTIREIVNISPIENADRLELAKVSGWNVVIPKGKHQVGEKVAYFEIDSFLPESNPLFDNFTKRSTKRGIDANGSVIRGHMLKTIKLRGQVSQGLIMSLDDIGLSPDSSQDEVDNWAWENGVSKYRPVTSGGSLVLNSFPSKYARKTDSQRVQNLSDDFLASLNKDDWYATEKVDGTSATFFVDDDGVFRAASRNWEITLEDTSHWSLATEKFNLPELMSPGQVVQAEIYGEGIQSNPLKINGVDIAVFSTKNITEKDGEIFTLVENKRVPVLDIALPDTVEEAVAQVDGMNSSINPAELAEGVVWWNRNEEVFAECDDRSNFKSINNQFLLKHD